VAVLTFRLFDMPVAVRGSFLLIAALVGVVGVGDFAETAAWIAIVFVSILVHELGHALTAKMYGSQVSIELNGFGGLTRWAAPDGELTPGRRALIAAAGSATGLVVGALVWLIARPFAPYPPLTSFILENVVYVNVFWGLLNWLPIRPLDGGHLLESLLEKVAPRRGEVIARAVYTATAAIALAVAIRMGLIFMAVLSGWLLLSELNLGRSSQPAVGLPTLSYDEPNEGTAEPEFPGTDETPLPEDAEETPH